jgi:hypothetical protein
VQFSDFLKRIRRGLRLLVPLRLNCLDGFLRRLPGLAGPGGPYRIFMVGFVTLLPTSLCIF